MNRYRSTLAAGLLLAAAAPARADVIDRAFVRNAPAIMAKVRDLLRGTDPPPNVAVLKFEVKIGDKPASFDAGPANTKLAQKLENLLILANNPKDKVFVLSDAGPAAAAAAKATGAPFTWRTEAGRAAFFRLEGLPLAWDRNTDSLRPNAFVTGRLELSGDLSEAKVTLYGFTRKAPAELVELLTVTGTVGNEAARPLNTDRSILALAGVAYAVGSRVGPNGKADAAARKLAKELFSGTSPADVEKAYASVTDQSPVSLEVLLNGTAVPVRPDPDSPGNGIVAWPNGSIQPTDSVEFRLTNKSSTERYAVLLAVNGRNTNAKNPEDTLDARDARDQRKWVLEPNDVTRVRGFYTDLAAGKYQPFAVLSETPAAQLFGQMDAKYRGRISLYVYAERPEKPPADSGPQETPPTKPPTQSQPPADPRPAEVVKKEEEEATLLMLGWGNGGLEKVRSAGSLEKAQQEMKGLTNTGNSNGQLAVDPAAVDQYRRRGLIVSSEQQRTDGPIKTLDFRLLPQPVACLSIRYYQPDR